MIYVVCYLAGLFSALFFISFLLKKVIRNEKALSEVIYRVYHQDYMPYIARFEGLIKLYLLDPQRQYLDLAIDEIQAFKAHLLDIIKKHE